MPEVLELLSPTSPVLRSGAACEVEELLPPYATSRALEEGTSPPKVDEEAVEAALSPGGLLEAPDVLGRRPLHQAAEAGRADLVTRLLDSKADADATTAARDRLTHGMLYDIHLSLTRAPGDETWGFEFDAFQERQRRQVLKEILPNTPAGRWNQKPLRCAEIYPF
eukprot:s607_g1.t1